MIKGIKAILYPTKKQEQMFWQSTGNARFVYNWGLGKIKGAYDQDKTKLSVIDARKQFNEQKYTDETISWVLERSQDIPDMAFQDLKSAFKRFFDNLRKGIPFKQAGYPAFKKKGIETPSFAHDSRKLKVKGNRVYFEKIGWVRFSGELPVGDYKKEKIKVSDPRIKHDGKAWYLAVGLETEEEKHETNPDLSIGVDLGISMLATTNVEGLKFKNINKSAKVKRLNKKLRRKQRALARSREANIKSRSYDKNGKLIKKSIVYHRPLKECQNYQKIKKETALVHRKLHNIRKNHLHQATKKIIERKPSKIVMENLNVKGMMKNKNLAHSIGNSGWRRFREYMDYKAKFYLGVEVTYAPRFYPSSKTCSCCGKIDKTLKLHHRKMKCGCGNKMDRDLNASINLANYNVR